MGLYLGGVPGPRCEFPASKSLTNTEEMFIKKKCYSNVFLIQQVIIINHKLLIEFLKHTLPLLIRRPAHQNNSNLYIFFLCINKIENQHQIVFQSRGARKAPGAYHFYFGFYRFSKH